MIDALTAEGQPVAQAIRAAGVPEVEYDQWRIEYGGLMRTLGPLLCAPPKRPRRSRRAGPGRPGKAQK